MNSPIPSGPLEAQVPPASSDQSARPVAGIVPLGLQPPSDRELLELAAKAAGYLLTWEGDNPPYPRAAHDGRNPCWNPLTDDGDALRLAAVLEIHIEWSGARGRVDSVQASPKGLGHFAWVELTGDDRAAATRRAIVHAAAEIGRAQNRTAP